LAPVTAPSAAADRDERIDRRKFLELRDERDLLKLNVIKLSEKLMRRETETMDNERRINADAEKIMELTSQLTDARALANDQAGQLKIADSRIGAFMKQLDTLKRPASLRKSKTTPRRKSIPEV
jgi:hypothetical protein